MVSHDKPTPILPKEIETFDDAQASVAAFLQDIMGPERPKRIEERAYRFFEEAAELVSACGVEFEDLVLLLAYVYYKATPAHKRKEEAGDATYALAGLLNALNVNMAEAVQEAAKKCRQKQEIIALKASEYQGGPLPGGVLSQQVKKEHGVTIAGNLGAQLKVIIAELLKTKGELVTERRTKEERYEAHEQEIKRIIAIHKVRTGEVEAFNATIDELLAKGEEKDRIIEKLEAELRRTRANRDIPVRTTEQGHVGVITGDPARLEILQKVDDAAQQAARDTANGEAGHPWGAAFKSVTIDGEVAALRRDLNAHKASTEQHIREKNLHIQERNNRILRLENELDNVRRTRDGLLKKLETIRNAAV